jgi:hypothetical protein
MKTEKQMFLIEQKKLILEESKMIRLMKADHKKLQRAGSIGLGGDLFRLRSENNYRHILYSILKNWNKSDIKETMQKRFNELTNTYTLKGYDRGKISFGIYIFDGETYNLGGLK